MAVIVPFIQRRKWMALGISLLIALLAPSSQVPPAWWQGGWRRQHVGSDVRVELLSQLAAVLMPKTPVGEMFRSFPSVDRWSGDFVEPDLTAYGVLKDPHAALFVLYDGCHEKREETNQKIKIDRLLAFSPPGSHVLVIGQLETSSSKGDCFCIELSTWRPGDGVMLSKVLRDLLGQVCDGLGRVLCPDVLERMQFIRQTSPVIESTEAEEFMKTATTLTSLESTEEIENYLAAEGFNHANTDRMQKVTHLIGLSAEIKFQSRIWLLLDQGQSHDQAAEEVAAQMAKFAKFSQSSQQILQSARQLYGQGLVADQAAQAMIWFPSFLVCRLRQNLRLTVEWLLEIRLAKPQIIKAIQITPQTIQAKWNLAPAVQWLLDLGLTRQQLLKAAKTYPAILGYCPECDFEPKAQWLLELGLKSDQIAKVITTSPKMFVCDLEGNLKPKAWWLLDLGLSYAQVAKVIRTSPQVFTHNLEQNLQPTVQWLLDLGLARLAVARAIARFPGILSCSPTQKLKPIARWLMELGMDQSQIAKALEKYPSIFRCSLERKLKPTVQGLLDLGLTRVQVAKMIAKFPQAISCSLEKRIKPKLQWFLTLGIRKDQLAGIVVSFPSILSLSISNNLNKKWPFLQEAFGKSGVADLIARRPTILGYSYQRLRARFSLLSELNETMKLASAMDMPEDQFRKRFINSFKQMVKRNRTTEVWWLTSFDTG